MRRQIILTKGLPASGKSTWAKSMVGKHPGEWTRVNKDDLRSMLHNSRWSNANEKMVEAIRDACIHTALTADQNVIVDDTNFEPRHFQHIRSLFGERAEITIKGFEDVSIETCIQRDAVRANSVGEKVIRRMWRQYLFVRPTPIDWIEGIPSAILCDLDGTLAELNGRNPYDASTCENDGLNPAVAQVVRDWPGLLILMSGRQEKDRAPTERWLKAHEIDFDALHMRSTDDMRKDSVIKHELFDAHVRGKYNVAYVLDDRDQVVQLWRDVIGLTCLQVNWGAF